VDAQVEILNLAKHNLQIRKYSGCFDALDLMDILRAVFRDPNVVAPIRCIADARSVRLDVDEELVSALAAMTGRMISRSRQDPPRLEFVVITDDASLRRFCERLAVWRHYQVFEVASDLDEALEYFGVDLSVGGIRDAADPVQLFRLGSETEIVRYADLKRQTDEIIRRLGELVPTQPSRRSKSLERLRDWCEGYDLSARESELVRLFAFRPNVEKVSREMAVSMHTVRNHLKSIYRKLQVRSAAELVSAALVVYMTEEVTQSAEVDSFEEATLSLGVRDGREMEGT